MSRLALAVFATFALLALAAPPASKPAAPVAYPKDYRRWLHSKSMIIPDKAHGLYGFHHVYVEPKALEAYKAGSGYPDGARVVVPFHEVKEGGGMLQEGAIRMIAVMERDASKTDTGGWRWAAFDGAGKALEMDVKAGCFTCHIPKGDRAFVYSEWTER